MLKGVLEKALSTILVGAIMGVGTLFYNEYQTYEEIKALLKTEKEMRNEYIRFRKKVNERHKKDSLQIKYNKGWIDYWVSLQNN